MQTTERLSAAIHTAEALYYRLVLLVGPPDSGKTNVLRHLGAHRRLPVVNINLTLSAALLGLSHRQRALRLPALLDRVTKSTPSVLLLDNLEILFDIHLQQDPLRLLQQLARQRTVVASWSGTVTGGKLTYAISGHPEHRAYEASDLLIVSLEAAAPGPTDTDPDQGSP